jgi:hypothetical protein
MWKTKLKEKWDEDPITCIAVGSFAVVAAAKLIDSMGGYQSRRAYARQVEYKVAR